MLTCKVNVNIYGYSVTLVTLMFVSYRVEMNVLADTDDKLKLSKQSSDNSGTSHQGRSSSGGPRW